MTLELWPLPKWTGQVLSPEGLPVKQFRVQLAPLDDSDVEQVIVRDYAEAEGRFTLDFEQAGPHWLAIQAEGYAAWEKTIKVGKEPQSLDVRLDARSDRYGTGFRPPAKTARGAGGSGA